MGLPADDGPDESECRSACANLACTHRNIDDRRAELRSWEAAAHDRRSPRPMRDRAGALAAELQSTITAHESTASDAGRKDL
ncbi:MULTISPECIES: hypothetical protein [Streptacidiphilus]|uniref:Uncharacterized protein n=1 Tax=Streptacidiphilus cavernicola TaxID=3342716 RepID=A0ABV6UP74_9ACTN|nr:hypothetical protein [Streptacidiphilus jeojiense]